MAPISTQLSQALVAFTIELDNEFERRMPHRTTRTSSRDSREGPWLVSLAMWFTCMRFVSADGVTAGELERLARTRTNLDGLRRWGYIIVDPAPGGAAVIRPTRKGRRAQKVWPELLGVIEERWRRRFGDEEIDRLRQSLAAIADRLDPGLPDCLPILRHGLFSVVPAAGAVDSESRAEGAVGAGGAGSGLSLVTLLSRVLLAFAVEFEAESELPLAISANALRVLDERGVRVRDLPRLTGVSKEANAMAMGILTKRGLAVIEPDPVGGRWKVARLLPRGRAAQESCRRLLGVMEDGWRQRYGDGLREALERLVGRPALWDGMVPPPGGWRTGVRRPETLPHYPMVLHRGGFPDGS